MRIWWALFVKKRGVLTRNFLHKTCQDFVIFAQIYIDIIIRIKNNYVEKTWLF